MTPVKPLVALFFMVLAVACGGSFGAIFLNDYYEWGWPSYVISAAALTFISTLITLIVSAIVSHIAVAK